MKRRKFSDEERARILREYEESGLTQKEYSRRTGIGVNNLVRWRKQTKASKGGMRFVEVEHPERRAKRANGYRMEHRCGLSLEFGEGFEEQEIRILAGIIQEVGKCST